MSNVVSGSKGGSEINEIFKGSRAGWISSGMFKERWYATVRMATSTVERKF